MEQITEPLKTESRVSWTTRLKSLEINAQLPVDKSYTNTARQAIYKVQNETDMKFGTKRTGSALVVTRIV